MKKIAGFVFALTISPFLFAQDSAEEPNEQLIQSRSEKHLANVRQLTFGGDNAKPRFSFNSQKLSFQSNNPLWDLACHQVFWLDIEEASDNKIYQPMTVSNGEGSTASSCYFPDNKRVLYASTFKAGKNCVPQPEAHQKSVHEDYDLYIGDEKGKTLKQLTNTPGYDAEAAISPKGDKIVFTSMRNGDPDLYIMDVSGKNIIQLTRTMGYDGNAFFSPDGSRIIFTASRPAATDTVAYKELLGRGFVSVARTELFVINTDGTGLKQLTKLGKTNDDPVYHPSGKKILFSSNHLSANEQDFQLFMINEDGTGLEQISAESMFNVSAVFSPDGKKIAFSSGRNNGGTKEVNVFVADWIE